MKSLTICILLAMGALHTSMAMTNYVVDVEFTHTDESITLRLDADGHAKRDYDAFVKYPSEYEVTDDAVRPAKWEERGIGTFIEVTVALSDKDISLSIRLDAAEFLGLNEYEAKGIKTKSPVFRSIATTIDDMRVWAGQWVMIGGIPYEDNPAIIRVRVREEAPNHGIEPAGDTRAGDN